MRVPNFSGVGQQIQKALNISLVLILSSSSLAVSGPLFLSQKAFAAAPNFSTASNTNGWSPQDGNPTYVDGPTGSDGNGSLKLTTDSQSKQDYFKSTDTPLSEVSNLGYKLYDTAGIPASYQLQVLGVHRTDSSSTFTSLVWEPVYNSQANGPNGGFVNEANIETGIWWSSHPIDGDPLGNNGFVSLGDIIAANPGAFVVAYGVNVGSGTPNATSYVDDVSFGSDVTNFEMSPSIANGDFAICTKVAGCGYDGIDVGFSLSDFASISNISVTLSKNGQNIATNTAKQPMLDYYNNHTGTTLSTPFVINSGSFDPSSDTYWSYGSHTWRATDQPDAATVTVTGVDSSDLGQTLSTSNSSLAQGLASFASFFPGQLTVGYNPGDFASIQGAINAAAPGDTIYIANGSYNEALNITQNNLQLLGQSLAGVIVNQTVATSYGQGVSIDGFSDVGISNMTFNTPEGSPVSYALQAYQAPGLSLSDVTFDGPGKTGVNLHGSKIGGVDVNSSSSVRYNNVSVSHYSKNGFSVTAKYTANDTASANLTFSNVMAADNNWAGLAFYNTNSSGSVGNSITGVTFSGASSFTGNGQGIFVEGDSDANFGAGNPARYAVQGLGGATLSLSGANLSGNAQDVVNYQSSGFNAGGNWWGNALGPNTSQYIGDVAVDSWCTDSSCSATQSASAGTTSLPSGPITTPTINSGQASIVLPSTNDIVATASTPAGTLSVTIPKGVTITTNDTRWNGTISAPTVVSNSTITNVLPANNSAVLAISVGSSSASLTFDRAVKITFPDQKGQSVGFVRNGVFTQISDSCDSYLPNLDTNLNGGACYTSSGSDLIVWTEHFTTFVAYSQAAQPSTPSSTSSGSSSQTSSPNSTVKTASSNSTSSGNGSNGEVLGASTTTPSNSTPTSTLSTKSTQPSNALAFEPPAKSTKKILGIAWYFWLLVIAALAVAGYLSYSYRSLDRD